MSLKCIGPAQEMVFSKRHFQAKKEFLTLQNLIFLYVFNGSFSKEIQFSFYA